MCFVQGQPVSSGVLGTYVIYFDYLQPNNYTQPGFFEIPLLHGIEDGGMY